MAIQGGPIVDTKALTSVIEKQDWIEPAANAIQNATTKAFDSAGEAGKTAQDFLHGVWLGHPLHPVLTDGPIGAWSVGVALDVIDMVQGRDDLSPGADAAIALGTAAAVGAAVTGLTDWHVLKEEKAPKRVGFAHMLFNVTATSLFAASWVCRARKARAAGRVLSFCGYAAALAGAWLGGTMVYEDEIGVDHAQREGPKGWSDVMADPDLQEGQIVKVETGGVKILLARDKGRVFAIGEVCSHLGGPLSEGKLENGCVTCPWHASTFRLEDGQVVHGPATLAQPKLETRVRKGRIEIRAKG